MTELVDSDLFCPECGYNLRGIDSARCPECGMEIDRSKLGESIIPWLHRQQIGRFRAFWRTVNLVLLHPRALAREMNLPARFDEAVRFRRVVVLHALVPLGIALSIISIGGYLSIGSLWVPQDVAGSILQILSVPLVGLCEALFLFGITGACSYFFHPRWLSVIQQNRAVALSYYACAPLAYLPLAIILFVSGSFAAGALNLRTNSALWMSGIVLLVCYVPLGITILAVIRTPGILVGVTTHCGPGRQWAAWIGLPVIWALLGFGLLIVLPLMGLLVMLMIVSLTHS